MSRCIAMYICFDTRNPTQPKPLSLSANASPKVPSRVAAISLGSNEPKE